MKKIGIITSGGDCGGLNAVIIGAAKMANKLGVEAVIIPNGYAGLYNIENLNLVTLDTNRIEQIKAIDSGSNAGHSRVKISKIKDEGKYDRIKKGLAKQNIDGLVIAGGDDTGSVVVDLLNQGIKCIHLPKTMDLDLQTYSVGGDSTINRISRFTNDLHTTAITHNRVLIIEVFGRYAGHTAFRGGIGADADAILIPEVGVDFEIVYKHFKETYFRRLRASDVKRSTYMIVAAEGLTDKKGSYFTESSAGVDSFGHARLAGAGKFVRSQLEHYMNQDPDWKEILTEEGIFVENIYQFPEIREVTLGHLVRSGQSSSYDVNFGKQVGGAAVQLLVNDIFGVTVAGIEGSNIKYLPTKEAIVQRFVDLDEVAFHENLGVCFGREPVEYKPNFIKQESKISRYM
ncbi:MAG: 6-phosphofructokinase [Ignavibacteria bacterium GWF2_33_9]|nr:MAG: 6-phosphofructokinase [Ignavibacteria bacterium GWF2_33_9]